MPVLPHEVLTETLGGENLLFTCVWLEQKKLGLTYWDATTQRQHCNTQPGLCPVSPPPPISFSLFSGLEMNSRAPCMLAKCSTSPLSAFGLLLNSH